MKVGELVKLNKKVVGELKANYDQFFKEAINDEEKYKQKSPSHHDRALERIGEEVEVINVSDNIVKVKFADGLEYSIKSEGIL